MFNCAQTVILSTEFLHTLDHSNLLSGFAQVITTPSIELDEKSKQEIKQEITTNTERITHLVDKMIELADANSKTVIERTDRVPAIQVAAQAIEASGISHALHLTFSMETAPEAENATVQTNLRAAARALIQLLDNALKFTRTPKANQHNDTYKKTTERAMLKMALNGKEVLFTVEDTGIGVPVEEAEHIFDEFVQLDEYYEGTGIGLTVARSIARRLSNYTGGARFVMTLPVH